MPAAAAVAVAVALPSPTWPAEPGPRGQDRGDPHGHARVLGVHDPRLPRSRTLTARALSYVCRSAARLGTLLRALSGERPPRSRGGSLGAFRNLCLSWEWSRRGACEGVSGMSVSPILRAAAGGWRPGLALPERRASAEHGAGPRHPAPPPRLLPPGCSRSSSPLAAPPRSKPPQPTPVASSLSACHANPLQSRCHF